MSFPSAVVTVIIIYTITNIAHPSPSPPRRSRNGFDTFNAAAAPVNTAGVLVVLLGAFGVVVDASGGTLLVTGGDIEVCKDVGVESGVTPGVLIARAERSPESRLAPPGLGLLEGGAGGAGGAGVGVEAGGVARADSS